ncbi:class I SAM-dependent methyltransferase [Croceitalea sp. MTPC9]|uniref:class I SAM-dependent methyltransferase n=1 Tax=unclassified Croceitalea TaxID=2632280 RepID=UPI002B3E6CF8|nr:class I SAM-dependent methyltransferase [Croceitalea sp. MTPC6]GMN17087.1 class I SAM-dependent methyltransferase [Croceitalea sp. MTPC9]
MTFFKKLFKKSAEEDNKGLSNQENKTSFKSSEVPIKKVMSEVYSKKKWGGSKYDFYSGFGSHSKKVVKPYVKTISEFLNSHSNSLLVCDLGCGDFNVGSQLVKFSKEYIGVDVVEELIERNKKLFTDEKLSFQCLNIVEESLPKTDCILVRQVLQHLSNNDIKKVVEKFKAYKYVIVTEHLPKRTFMANLDKITGANIRLSRNSGVVLHENPFNIAAKSREELLRIKYNKGIIVTTLYNF